MISLAMALLLAGAQTDAQCSNAVTQADMTGCAVREFNAADAAMNRQWKLTLAAMHNADRYPAQDGRPTYANQLLAAQRAWLAYRDAHCVSAGYAARGGSMEPMLVAQCRAKLTRERTEQLKALIGNH